MKYNVHANRDKACVDTCVYNIRMASIIIYNEWVEPLPLISSLVFTQTNQIAGIRASNIGCTCACMYSIWIICKTI